jgi:hypothetical protein
MTKSIYKIKKSLKLNTNLYLVLILIALIILFCYLFDKMLLKVQNKLEHFTSPTPSPSITQTVTDEEINEIMKEDSVPAPSNEPSISKEEESLENNNFMYEIENKDIELADFYPSSNLALKKNKDEILDFTFRMDLFHQLLPNYPRGYLGIIWYDERINGIYQTDTLESKKWTKVDNDIPENMLRPIFITYDKDRKLIGIFKKKEGRYAMFKKDSLEIDSKWNFIENTTMISVIYDGDERMIGLDDKGNFYKKDTELLESQWTMVNYDFTHIPMRRVIFDYETNIMMGISHEFTIYKKKTTDWMKSEWDTVNGPTLKTLSGRVRDLLYDYDGHLIGLSRVGLVKKKERYYLSEFKMYETKKEKNVSIYKLLYAITGIKNMIQYESNNANNLNNVYVDGKKISEYKFKDPRLNEYLKYRMNLKKRCRKLKSMRLKDDDENVKAKTELRNQKFNDVLLNQKNTIDDLMDTIKYLKDRSF